MKDEFLKAFGERAAARRQELGLSQLEVAHKIGFKTRQAYSLVECGERGLSQSKCVALADALDTTVEYLMGAESDDRQGKISSIETLFSQLDTAQQTLVTNLIESLLSAKKE